MSTQYFSVPFDNKETLEFPYVVTDTTQVTLCPGKGCFGNVPFNRISLNDDTTLGLLRALILPTCGLYLGGPSGFQLYRINPTVEYLGSAPDIVFSIFDDHKNELAGVYVCDCTFLLPPEAVGVVRRELLSVRRRARRGFGGARRECENCHGTFKCKHCPCRAKTSYCSKACQHSNWAQHKSSCSWYQKKFNKRCRKKRKPKKIRECNNCGRTECKQHCPCEAKTSYCSKACQQSDGARRKPNCSWYQSQQRRQSR